MIYLLRIFTMTLESQLAEHQGYLLRFARLQLRNDAWAEDAVSDTLLAALEKPQSFAGQSQLKTWLVGILKHKLIDQLRRHTREIASSPDDDDGLEDLGDRFADLQLRLELRVHLMASGCESPVK